MGSLEGKVSLVTGGGTGIGRAVAERFAREGARVMVAGRRLGPLEECVAFDPERIAAVRMDLGEAGDRERALDATLKRFGKLDILVNNAAASVCKPFLDHTAEEIQRVIHVNLVSTALLLSSALPHVIAQRGVVVNVGSAAAHYTAMPGAMLSAYAASKAGLDQLTRVLAVELGALGVRVNGVAPGFTDTEIAAEAFAIPEVVAAQVAATPLGRVGQPDDVARVVHFLASDEAKWVTGQIIDATGGYWMSI